MGTELANGRECKMVALKYCWFDFKVNQTKYFIMFVNSKVAGEYKMVCKDFILLY